MQTPEFSQAITTAIQIALVDMIKFVGMKPSLVVGHSSGEIAAAYCAGFLCHKSAMRVSYFRGLLASKLARVSATNPWGMASVGISAAEVPALLDELNEQASTAFDAEKITISCSKFPNLLYNQSITPRMAPIAWATLQDLLLAIARRSC